MNRKLLATSFALGVLVTACSDDSGVNLAGSPATALDRARELPIVIHGAGLILDWGHPHLFVIFPLGAPEEHVYELAEFFRAQPGIGNSFPQRLESSNAHGA